MPSCPGHSALCLDSVLPLLQTVHDPGHHGAERLRREVLRGPQLQANFLQVLGGSAEFPHLVESSFLNWTKKQFGLDGFQVLQL